MFNPDLKNYLKIAAADTVLLSALPKEQGKSETTQLKTMFCLMKNGFNCY